MRSKEEAADYRYFEEPDLPILEINNEWIDRVKSRLPELPFEKLNRYCSELGLSEYEAEIIIGNLPMTKYFETASSYSQSKHVINLLLRNVIGHLKENKITIEQFKLSPKRLAELAELLEQGKINSHTAQEIFAESIETQKSPA